MEVVVCPSTKIVVLQVTLAVECDVPCFDLPVLHVDLVTTEYDRNVLTYTNNISVPVGYVLVSDSRGHIKHDDRALTLNIVAITKTTELFLSGGIPHVEYQVTTVCAKLERVAAAET